MGEISFIHSFISLFCVHDFDAINMMIMKDITGENI